MGSGGIALPFLTSALGRHEWSTAALPQRRALRGSVDAVQKKDFLPCHEVNPDYPRKESKLMGNGEGKEALGSEEDK
jgi:hypothetical protein